MGRAHRERGKRPERRRPGLLTLCMIVKDEAHAVARTLRSAKPHIDRWVIVDTGSTDGTQAIVREVLEGVPGELFEASFVDFATTRNVALDRCGAETEFVMWMDADDVLEGGEALGSFLEGERSKRGADREAYFVRVDTGVRFDSPRILRARDGWRFVGVVHEVLCAPGKLPPTHRVPDALIRHVRTDLSKQRSVKRWERDVALLEGALERDPTDARAAFYLAETLFSLERYEEAIEAFERRVALGGWVEEVYQAKLHRAAAAEVLSKPWPEVLALYLDAHATAPHRAEALHAIAHHYNLSKEHALCFLFARRGYELPLPAGDHLFVDEGTYTWKLADLVGSSGYWIGEYALGEEALRKALRFRPDDLRLKQNLTFYVERKQRERAKRGR